MTTTTTTPSTSALSTTTTTKAPAGVRRGGRPPIDTPERVIGQAVRYRILTILAGVESMSFRELQEIVATNYGNLSLHARRLEAFGYVRIHKHFVARVPRTEYQITAEGRKALEVYLATHPR